MATRPLLLIPALMLPKCLMLHAAALMQSRQLIRSRASGHWNRARCPHQGRRVWPQRDRLKSGYS